MKLWGRETAVFCANLARRGDRREAAGAEFAREGVEVEFFDAVDGEGVRDFRGHDCAGNYACQLTHRLMVREAQRRGVGQVLVFEDDVVLREGFRRLVEGLEVPERAGMVLLGCVHPERRVKAGPGFVKVDRFWGTHAYVLQKKCFASVRRGLGRRPVGKPGVDNAFSGMAERLGIFAVRENLAWQREDVSDIRGKVMRRYDAGGVQLWGRR